MPLERILSFRYKHQIISQKVSIKSLSFISAFLRRIQNTCLSEKCSQSSAIVTFAKTSFFQIPYRRYQPAPENLLTPWKCVSDNFSLFRLWRTSIIIAEINRVASKRYHYKLAFNFIETHRESVCKGISREIAYGVIELWITRKMNKSRTAWIGSVNGLFSRSSACSEPRLILRSEFRVCFRLFCLLTSFKLNFPFLTRQL